MTPSRVRCLASWTRLPIAIALLVSLSGIAHAGAGAWTTGGPYGGTISALAVDPGSPAVLYAGSPASGIFKSTDEGASWSDASRGLYTTGYYALGPAAVHAIAIDPRDSRRLFAGTAGGAYASTDAGASWSVAGAGILGGKTIRALAIDPTRPSTVFAGCEFDGVYGSFDSGKTWTRLMGYPVSALAIDPLTPSTVYAGGRDAGVYKTITGGDTWTWSGEGLGSQSIRSLAVDPRSPSTVYAGTSWGVVKSTDSGRSWTAVYGGAGGPREVLVLAIDPENPARVFAGTMGGAIVSTDSGASWAPLARLPGVVGQGVGTLAVSPAGPSTLYAGSLHGGGVFRSEAPEAGWVAASAGLTALVADEIVVDPGTPASVFTAVASAGVFRSTDSGETWLPASTGLGGPAAAESGIEVDALALGRASPSVVYAALRGGAVYRSLDAGTTWQAAGALPVTAVVSQLAIDPSIPSTLYAATTSGIRRSTDSGSTWVALDEGLDHAAARSIAIDPVTRTTLYATTTRGLLKSTDSGARWSPSGAGLIDWWVHDLVIDPRRPEILYVTTANLWDGGHVFKTTDAGESWRDSSYGLVRGKYQVDSTIAIDPSTPTTLFVGGRWNGAFRSTDSGATWAGGYEGLGGFAAGRMAVDPTSPSTVFVCTRRGVWQVTGPWPGPSRRQTVLPIVLDVEAGHARYTTEVALTNDGEAQDVALTYTPSLGSREGGGSVVVTLPAGAQVVYADVLAALRALGLPVPEASPSSPQGGTLAVAHDTSLGRVHATARTTSPTSPPHPAGRAGVAYGAVTTADALPTRGVVFGLRSTPADRSNLAVHNPGTAPVTLRVTLHSGAGDGKQAVLADRLVLPPLGWTQLDNPLPAAGMTNAWAIVERTSSSGVFGAYGVVNDNATNDGSFVPAVPATSPESEWTVPVLVETPGYESELVLTNRESSPVRLTLRYRESLSAALAEAGTVDVTLGPLEQRILPSAIDFLRSSGVPIGPRGAGHYAGALRVTDPSGSGRYVCAGARTSAPSPAGGSFGVFTPALTPAQEAADTAAVHGLAADAFTRSNVAVVNVGDDAGGPVTLELAVHDGSDGGRVRETLTLSVAPGQWIQPGGFFADSGVANGYVTITRTEGSAPWLAYGVVNDGGSPGQRTGDGAYVPMVR